MSNPTELGDFTLKQLLYLNQPDDVAQGNQANRDSVISAKDTELFLKIMGRQSNENDTSAQQENVAQLNDSLTDILDSLIDGIDSN